MDIVDVLLEHGATYDTNDTVFIGEVIVSFVVVVDTVADDDHDNHDDHDDCHDEEEMER